MNKLNLLPRATRSAKKEKLVKKNASKKETGVSTEPPHTVDCGSNTELSMAKLKEVVDGDQPNEVVKMLKSAVPSERYFELIAEERRKALDEALQENLQLSQEIARLREENSQLKVLAEEGLKYAEILRQVVGDEEPAN
ncbi:unnamed protein product [Soboliphyme baturini]|uniref:Geminin n=1 Tax=Soboliphyme baturini TaxID=241478 RepID=A0A183IJN6_9BILA|nr:unnamed protein product [Soboliphyme baturini]